MASSGWRSPPGAAHASSPGVARRCHIFAEVPHIVERTAEGVYEFLGGHRLWYAPEALERTYWPDLAPPEVTTLECGARFAAPPDAAGITKELTCSLALDRPEARIDHRLTNVGRWPVQ